MTEAEQKIRDVLMADKGMPIEDREGIDRLRDENDLLKHTIKALQFELSARYAANMRLKEIIRDITDDGEGTDEYD